METPSSTRRVTRSQTKKMQESERIVNNSRIGQRALVDVTNDSPIIGLAKTKVLKTPSSEISKKRVSCKIQGSGESILRGQVKTLLQKVEEKTEILRPLNPLKNILESNLGNSAKNSSNIFDDQVTDLDSVTPCFFNNKISISQMGSEKFEEKKDLVTRSLIFDFMEKFDGYDSCEEEKDGGTIEDGELVNELCEGMSKMNIEKARKHTRFVYDSDDELVEVEEEEIIVTSAALALKGLPKREGKHIRFQDED